MTDETHGEPPHDHEIEAHVTPEEEHHQSAETWHGGAPENDFGGDDAAGEIDSGADETATVSEETEHLDEDETPAPTKKRSFLLPAVATGSGILLLGVLAYWQFGDSLHGDQTMPMMTASAVKQNPAGDNFKPLPNVSATAAKTDLTVPAAPVTQPANNPLSQPTTVTSSIPVAATVASATPPPAKTDSVAADARINALTTQITDLQKALDQATQQLSAASAKLTVSQNSNTAADEHIKNLEQKILQMQSVTASSEPAVIAPEPVEGEVEATPPAPPPIKHRAPAKQVKHKPVVHHETVAKTHWVLRAATPTEAWVAKDASTPDLKAIHVGDALAGIGVVEEIHEENGSWVVDGSKGKIH